MMAGRVKKWNRGEMMSDELMAATVGDADWLRLSLNKAKGKVAVDQNGYNAVHLAALHGRLECLKVLVEDYHMDVNLANPKGWSPIHLILNEDCKFRALKCLKYLLRIGANPNAYLANIVWTANRTDFSTEMEKLQQLKLILLAEEKHQYEIQKEAKDYLTNETYTLWLERKHLANILRTSTSFSRPRSTASELMLRQLRESVKTDESSGGQQTLKVVRFTKAKGPCRSKMDPGSEKEGLEWARSWKEGRVPAIQGLKAVTCTTPRKGICQLKPIWNVSINPASPPVTAISRQIEADLDIDPATLIQQHDFGLLYELVLDHAGHPELRSKVSKGTWPLPTLPFNIIKRELFPDTKYHRIRMPEEFKAVNIFNLPKKRRPVKNKSEIDIHLRECLTKTAAKEASNLAGFESKRSCEPSIRQSALRESGLYLHQATIGERLIVISTLNPPTVQSS
ncbi:ankyrin repeat domain-containing protein 53 [Heterodontus francisci]|uniref:ankyrin repeat domain-containing protein 53 n=1 Tax=Heterodontus francisci TaxID=7792 RepID=UPI00355B0334